MRRMPWAVYLWPGLPQVWSHGSWSGLAAAAAAAVLLNLALLGSFGWTELVAPGVHTAIWLLLGMVWLAAAVVGGRGNARDASRATAEPEHNTFSEALDHYLKGNWFETERALGGLLRHNARDVEARLMLATLLRRTGRLDDAAGQLEWLARIEDAAKWELEIQGERQLLAEARTRKTTGAEPTAELAAAGIAHAA